MKRIVLIAACILTLLLLCSCKAKEPNNMIIKTDKAITVINEVKEADIWLLPETQENLKTTVWGAATAAGVKTGTQVRAPLCEAGDNGLYIFRMIDKESFYYSANGIALEAGDTLRITQNDNAACTLEVSGSSGEVKASYEVFSARL